MTWPAARSAWVRGDAARVRVGWALGSDLRAAPARDTKTRPTATAPAFEMLFGGLALSVAGLLGGERIDATVTCAVGSSRCI